MLVGEGDAATALGFVNALCSRGYIVVGAAATEGDAVRMAAEHRPAIAVVAARLAAGCGISAGEAIRRNFATSVLFFAADCAAWAAELRDGYWCLEQPFALPDLVAAVDAIARVRAGLPPGAMPGALVRTPLL